MKVTVISFVIGALETVPKGLKEDRPVYNMVEVSQNAKKNLEELWKHTSERA